MEATTSTKTPILQRRPTMWVHAFVYFWLTFGLLLALLHPQPAVPNVLVLVLVIALAAWYWHWQVSENDTGADARALGALSPQQTYLMGGLLLWAVLILLDRNFVMAGVAVLAPYCFGSVRWALLSLVPCIGSWLWAEAVHGGLDWEEVVVAVAAVVSGVAVSGYIGSLTRQNAERQRLIDELRDTRDELVAAERRAGMLAERHRLARDIHDTLTQGFASIVMLLEAAEASLEVGGAPSSHIAQALRSARDNLAESRRLVWALRPDALADCQLPDALRDLLAKLEEENGVLTELVVTGTPYDLGQEIEVTLLRLAQEALANVRKHANASRVTITVSYMEDVTVLDIQDDGAGFDPTSAASAVSGNGGRSGTGGLGLRAMRERAEELGGRLTVETVPGEGTTVVAEVPAHPAPDQPAPEQPATKAETGS